MTCPRTGVRDIWAGGGGDLGESRCPMVGGRGVRCGVTAIPIGVSMGVRGQGAMHGEAVT